MIIPLCGIVSTLQPALFSRVALGSAKRKPWIIGLLWAGCHSRCSSDSIKASNRTCRWFKPGKVAKSAEEKGWVHN